MKMRRLFVLLVVILVSRGMLPCFGQEAPRRFPPIPETPAGILWRCSDFRGSPSPDEMKRRAQSAVQQLKDTEYEDDALLALAEREISMKDFKPAIKILQDMKSDTASTKFDIQTALMGWPRSAEYLRSTEAVRTTKSADHALLLLARAYEKMGRLDDAWRTLEELRTKYPKGEHVQEIKKLVLAYKKKNPDRFAMSQNFRVYRGYTLHLQGLKKQARFASTHAQFAGKRLGILVSILQLYEPILSDGEIVYYCAEGLKELPDDVGKEETRQMLIKIKENAKKSQENKQTQLIDMIESGPPDIAQEAARTLRHTRHLNEKQRKRLIELKQKVRDPKLVKDIDEILKPSERRPGSIRRNKNQGKSENQAQPSK